MGQEEGAVVIPAGIRVWPHELSTAQALANAGHTVEFLRKTEGRHVKSADIAMDGAVWEMKAPETSNLKHLQQTLRRAARQSPNVVVDTARLRGISDMAAEQELRRLKPLVRSIRRMVLVTRRREVVDIR